MIGIKIHNLFHYTWKGHKVGINGNIDRQMWPFKTCAHGYSYLNTLNLEYINPIHFYLTTSTHCL